MAHTKRLFFDKWHYDCRMLWPCCAVFADSAVNNKSLSRKTVSSGTSMKAAPIIATPIARLIAADVSDVSWLSESRSHIATVVDACATL